MSVERGVDPFAGLRRAAMAVRKLGMRPERQLAAGRG